MSSEGPPVPPGPPLPPEPPSPYEPPRSSGGSPPPPDGARLPWEIRDQLGIAEALLETIKLLVTDPAETYARIRRDGDLTSPLLFAIILGWIGGFLNQLWSYLFNSSIRTMFGGMQGLDRAFPETSFVAIVAILVAMPVLIVIGVFISSGIFHLCLLLVGGTNDSPIGFEGTLKVVAYAQVAGLAAILPVFGSMVAAVWTLVLDGVGFTKVHRTSPGKAVAAVLIPSVVCCLCVMVMVVAFGAAIAAIIAGAQQ